MALDADSGEYRWHYQQNPREAWDYKATANMVTATLEIAGKPRKVLMQLPTNGFYYVLDRETGALISAGNRFGSYTPIFAIVPAPCWLARGMKRCNTMARANGC